MPCGLTREPSERSPPPRVARVPGQPGVPGRRDAGLRRLLGGGLRRGRLGGGRRGRPARRAPGDPPAAPGLRLGADEWGTAGRSPAATGLPVPAGERVTTVGPGRGHPRRPARRRPRRLHRLRASPRRRSPTSSAGPGASVGSLYHHFGGKADLYLALFEDYAVRQEERAPRRGPRGPAGRGVRPGGAVRRRRRGPTSTAAGPSATSRGCSSPAADHPASSWPPDAASASGPGATRRCCRPAPRSRGATPWCWCSPPW